jgi:hypothetical protein
VFLICLQIAFYPLNEPSLINRLGERTYGDKHL